MGLLVSTLPIIFFLSLLFLIPLADASLVDENNIVTYHRDAYNFTYSQTSYIDKGYVIDFGQPTTGEIIVKIPNTFVILEHSLGSVVNPGSASWHVVLRAKDFNESDHPLDRESVKAVFFRSDCYRTYIFQPTSEYVRADAWVSSLAAGLSIPTSFDVPLFCLDIFENPPPYTHCKDGREFHINKRGDGVCILSTDALFERGYLA